MRNACGLVLCAVISLGGGCGEGDGPRRPDGGPEPTSTPAPVVTPTPTSTPIVPANAWSVGSRSEPGGPDTPGRLESIVLRSTDAGAHWTETLAVESGSFAGIAFADAARGWVVGFTAGSGEILRSDDGGITWSSQRAAVPVDVFSLEAVQASSRDVVVAVGGGAPLVGTGDAPSLIVRTEDAGATWAVATIAAGGGGHPERTRLTSVCINAAGIGFAVGSGVHTTALRTADRGVSWTDVTARVQNRARGELYRVACRDDEFWITTNGGFFVRYSADGGRRWRDFVPVTLDTALTGISAPARGVAVAVGVDATGAPLILRTASAGLAWTRQRLDPLDGAAGLSAVAFAGADDGTAVGAYLGFTPPTGSLTALAPTAGATWTRGDPVEGFVVLRDVARVP
jgi:hypothetical protein